jgi:PI31 proteasome regulator N-terminal
MSRLSVKAILQGMADALPTQKKDDSNAGLRGAYQVVALVVHSYLAALGFKLIGFNEGQLNLRM